MLVCTATSASASGNLLDLAGRVVEAANQHQDFTRLGHRLLDAAGKLADRIVCVVRGFRDRVDPVERVLRRLPRHLRRALNLAHRAIGFLRRSGLDLRASCDLLDRDEDLAGRAGQFLHRRRELLGRRADFDRRAFASRAVLQARGLLGQRLSGLLALVERDALLLHRLLRLGGGG
jgi:hypothetical protein